MKILSLIVLFAIAMALALVACGGGAAPTSALATAAPAATSAAPTTGAPTTAAPATGAPTTGAPTTTPAGGPTGTPAPKPTATPPPPGITAAPGALKIQFWHALTGASQVVEVQKLADKFNAANPSMYVSPSLQGNYDQAHQKVMAAITANSYADLVLGNPGDLADYNNAGAMVPLDDYINDPQIGLTKDQLAEIDQSLYFDKFDNKTLGISIGRSAQVMYYNADALKAAGFSQPPATFDDFDKVCAAVTKADFGCYAFIPSASTFANRDWNFGGQYSSSDEKTATFGDSAGVNALTWLKNQADKKWAYQPSGAFGDQTDFGNGKVEFTFGSTAGLPFYYQAVSGSSKPFNWSIAPMPSGPNGKNYVDLFGPSIGIMKTTPEKQKAAWMFLKFLLTKDVEVEWAQVTTYFPATKSAQDAVGAMDPATVSNKAFAAVLPLYKLAVSFLSNGKREPSSPAWQSVRSIIANMETAVFTGKSGPDFTATDPAGAAKEGVDRVNKALSQYGH